MVIKLLLLLSTLFSFPDDFYLFDYQRGFDWSEWEKDTLTNEYFIANVKDIMFAPIEEIELNLVDENLLEFKKYFHFIDIYSFSLKTDHFSH